MDTILAATPNGGLVQALGGSATTNGGRRRKVVPIRSVDEAERLLSRECGVAIVDSRCDFALDLIRKIKVEGTNGVARMPVILIDGDVTPEFQILTEERVASTADAAKIGQLVDDLIERRARRRRLFAQEISLELATTPENVERAGEVFDALIATTGFTEHDQVALSSTFRECVGNAAEHGNKQDPKKKIRVLYLRDEAKIGFVVTDEGAGFDHTKFLARADEVSPLDHTRSRRANEARPGGLGVFIMKKTCDAIVFNDRGNSIFLMKLLPGQGGKSDQPAAE
jgi:anti-sigma regulatory factor (Ser/Thr protein kinase)